MGCQHKKHTAEGDSIIDRIRLNILGLLSINEVLITAICIIHLHLIYLLFIVKLSSLELSQASGWTMQRMHVQSLYSFKASIIASVEYLIWWYMVLCVLYHSYMAAWELQTPTTKCLRKVTLFGSHLHLLFWTLYWHTTNIEKLQTEVNFFCVNVFHLKTACGSNLSNQSFFAPLCIKEKVQSVHFSSSWINKFRKCTLNKIWAP